MKNLSKLTTLILTITLVYSFNANAQQFPDPDKSPMDVAAFPSNYKVSNKDIKITYSRPFLQGRDINELIPNGEVWRTGANEAAELTLYKPMAFGDYEIPAGTYSFFVMPENDQWVGIISSQTNIWGSYFYDKQFDVARSSAPVKKMDSPLEVFSIVFEEKGEYIVMHLGWGHTKVTYYFSVIE